MTQTINFIIGTHLFYNIILQHSRTLEVTAALETVPPSDIEPYTGLPNKYFPSDHLSLKAYFKFASMKNKNEF